MNEIVIRAGLASSQTLQVRMVDFPNAKPAPQAWIYRFESSAGISGVLRFREEETIAWFGDASEGGCI